MCWIGINSVSGLQLPLYRRAVPEIPETASPRSRQGGPDSGPHAEPAIKQRASNVTDIIHQSRNPFVLPETTSLPRADWTPLTKLLLTSKLVTSKDQPRGPMFQQKSRLNSERPRARFKPRAPHSPEADLSKPRHTKRSRMDSSGACKKS